MKDEQYYTDRIFNLQESIRRLEKELEMEVECSNKLFLETIKLREEIRRLKNK